MGKRMEKEELLNLIESLKIDNEVVTSANITTATIVPIAPINHFGLFVFAIAFDTTSVCTCITFTSSKQ